MFVNAFNFLNLPVALRDINTKKVRVVLKETDAL